MGVKKREDKQKNHMVSRMAELPEGKCLQKIAKGHAGLRWGGMGICDRQMVLESLWACWILGTH